MTETNSFFKRPNVINETIQVGTGIPYACVMVTNSALGIGGAYALLFVVLRSEDYALLTGSVVVFAALAAVMLATVRTDWSAIGAAQVEKPAAEGSTIG